jgi:xylulokinase
MAEQLYNSEKPDPKTGDVYALMDERAARIPPGSGYLIFTPWMYGERAPIADCNVRSSFLNLSAEHTRDHLLRAVYEGISYNIRWIVEIIEKEYKFPLPNLRVIGGGAKAAPLMQILADVTQRKAETVRYPQEAGAVGAAMVAAVGLGIYPDFESLKEVVSVEKAFEPEPKNREIYDSLYRSYQEAYRSLRGFYKRLNERRTIQQRSCKEVRG